MNGDITKEYTVWCAMCEKWHQEPANTKVYFEKQIKKIGWMKTKENGWICPNH